MAESQFGELVKAVVDIETGAMALGVNFIQMKKNK
jgi:hypothetical protein